MRTPQKNFSAHKRKKHRTTTEKQISISWYLIVKPFPAFLFCFFINFLCIETLFAYNAFLLSSISNGVCVCVCVVHSFGLLVRWCFSFFSFFIDFWKFRDFCACIGRLVKIKRNFCISTSSQTMQKQKLNQQ